MKTLLALFTTLALVVAFAGTPAIADGPRIAVPLPKDLTIVPPDPTVPQKLARFSGKWFGTWDDNILNHILAVEEVDQNGAKVIYAHGTAPQWNIHEPRWFRVKGEFANGALKLYFTLIQVTVTYRMNEDGTIGAVYESPRAYSRITMRKE